jgi:hypothetical protein
MMTAFTQLPVLVLLLFGTIPAQHFARPDVPAKIAAPANEEVVLMAHASGSQIYICQAGADPWLLVNVTGHSGSGTLTRVRTIQRVHTKGGQAPATGCDDSHTGAESKAAYTADYYFYAPPK